jgi:hypothetical protein
LGLPVAIDPVAALVLPEDGGELPLGELHEGVTIPEPADDAFANAMIQ